MTDHGDRPAEGPADRLEAPEVTGDSRAYWVDAVTTETMKDLPDRWAGTRERDCRDAG